MSIWTLGLLVVGYFGLHSLLAANKTKALLQPIVTPSYYRLFYNIVSLSLLIVLIRLFLQMPTHFMFDAIPTLGIFFMLAGGILLIMAVSQYNMGEFSGTYQVQHGGKSPNSTLNRKGLNKYIRHPLYIANYVFFLGLLLYFPAYKTLMVVGVASIYLILGTRLEENKLVEEFGDAYRQYQKEVGMFLPKLRSKR